MRFKNFTLLFLMGIFGLFTTNLFAQEDATIAPEDIKFWIGEGQNEAIFISNWAEPDTALAWGYRFDSETVTIKNIMDAIAEVDPRFTYEATEQGWLVDLHFNDGYLNLSLVEQMWVSFLINGVSSWDTFDVATVENGQYVKMGDTHCGTLVDPVNYIYVWEKEVAPVYPYALEAMIDPSEILYWIGEGQNEVIFAVNFADPEDVCFAWGYRFDADDVIIQHMMDDIAAADGRFNFTASDEGWLTEITFVNGDIAYNLQGYNAMYNLNGEPSWYTMAEQAVHNGDFVKWGDYTIGTEVAAWTYVWETPVTPVSVYNTSVAENNATLSLYPNPASSYTMLDGEMNGATVTVSDLQGRVVRNFVVTNNEPVRIETESFQAGLYFVTVSDGSSRQTVKLSVK